MTATPAQIITVQQREVFGEQTIYVGPSVLVAAKTKPGHWYIVDSDRCTCAGFVMRGHCRHLAPAREAIELDRANAVAVEAVSKPAQSKPLACSRCGTTKRRLQTEEILCSPCLAVVHPTPLTCCAATTAEACRPDCTGDCCIVVTRCATCGTTVTQGEGEADPPVDWLTFLGKDYCPECAEWVNCDCGGSVLHTCRCP